MADLIDKITSHTNFMRRFVENVNESANPQSIFDNGLHEEVQSRISQSKEVRLGFMEYIETFKKAQQQLEESINSVSRVLLDLLEKESKEKKVENPFARGLGLSLGGSTSGTTSFYVGTTSSETTQGISENTRTDYKMKLEKLIGNVDEVIDYMQTKEKETKQELKRVTADMELMEKELVLLEKASNANKIQHETVKAEQRLDECKLEQDILKTGIENTREDKTNEQEENEQSQIEEEERKNKEEEDKRILEEEQERMEEEERQKKEEEERLKREEEERRKREEEEQRKREEEERRKREEEERKKREEEERRKREEEERRKREEEERRKREEEERKKREEEERRKREEERRRKEEEERRWKADPANWPKNIIKSKVLSDTIIGIVQTHSDMIGNIELTDQIDSDIDNVFCGDVEGIAVSDVVRLTSKTGRIECKPPLRLYIMERSRDNKLISNSNWTLIVNERTQNNSDKEHTPQLKRLPEIKGKQFFYMLLGEVEDSRFQVFAQQKTETFNFNPGKQTQIQPDMDKRITIDIPADAYASATDIKIKVFPIKEEVISDAEERRPKSAGHISGSSPILQVEAPEPVSAFKVELPIPKKDRNNATNMHLMSSNRKGVWTNNIYQKLINKGEKVKFDMENTFSKHTRIMILQTSEKPSVEDLETMAKSVEKHTMEIICAFVVKQHRDVLGKIWMGCLKRDTIKKTIQELEAQGFSNGPAESKEFYLSEGEVLEVRTRSNVEFYDGRPTKMVFCSNIMSATNQHVIFVKNEYTQKQLERYAGVIMLYKCKGDSEGSYYVDKDDPSSFICELPVDLPKTPGIDQKAVVKKAHLELNFEAPPITGKYFDEIKQSLAGRWRDLAEALGVPKTFACQAYTNNEERDTDTARDILVDWYKKCSMKTDKVTSLVQALRDIGMNHLAEDLLKRNKEVQEK